MKHYLFMDESGDHGLVNVDPAFPVFVLCGIILSEEQSEVVIRKMQEIKKRFWDDKKVLFHSRDIRKCNNEFQILFDQKV